MAVAVRTFRDVFSTGTWSGTLYERGPLLNDHPDSAGANYVENTAAGALQLYHEPMLLPKGSTDITVVLRYVARRQVASATIRGGLTVNGVTNYAAARTLTTDWTEYVETWTTNHVTGAPFQPSEVNAYSLFNYCYLDVPSGGGSGYKVQVASAVLEVEYTPPAASTGPRQIYKASSAGVSNTTSEPSGGGWQDKVSVTFTPPAGGQGYLILFSCLFLQSSGMGMVRLYYGPDYSWVTPQEYQIMPKDPTNWYTVQGGYVIWPDAGVPFTAKLQFARANGQAGTVSVSNAVIVAIPLSPFDFAGEIQTPSSNATSYETLASIPVDPHASGDYLVGMLTGVYTGSTSNRSGLKGVLPSGAEFGETYGVLSLNADERLPIALLTRAELAPGYGSLALAAKVQSSSITAYLRGGVMFALRLSEFQDTGWVNDVSEQGGVLGTAFTTIEELTHTFRQGDYLGIFGATFRNMSTSADQFIQVRDGGTAIATAQVEGRNVTAPYAHHSGMFLWLGDGQVAGSKTLDIRHRHEIAAASAFTKNTSIALLGYDVIMNEPVSVTGAAGASGTTSDAGEPGIGIAAAGSPAESQGAGAAGAVRLGLKLTGVTGATGDQGQAGGAKLGVVLAGQTAASTTASFAGAVRLGQRPEAAPGENLDAGLAGAAVVGLRLQGSAGASTQAGETGTAHAGVARQAPHAESTSETFAGSIRIGARPEPAAAEQLQQRSPGTARVGLKLTGIAGASSSRGQIGDVDTGPYQLVAGSSSSIGFAGAIRIGIRAPVPAGASTSAGMVGALKTGGKLMGLAGETATEAQPGMARIGIRDIIALGHSFSIGERGSARLGLRLAGLPGESQVRGEAPFRLKPIALNGIAGHSQVEGLAGTVIAAQFLAAKFPDFPRRNRRFDA